MQFECNILGWSQFRILEVHFDSLKNSSQVKISWILSSDHYLKNFHVAPSYYVYWVHSSETYTKIGIENLLLLQLTILNNFDFNRELEDFFWSVKKWRYPADGSFGFL